MHCTASITRHNSRWRWIPALLIATVVMLILLFPVARAAAVDDGTYGIRPATEADFFHLSAAPGASIDASAVVTNHTSEPVTLLTYPVDATSEANGFAMQDASAPRGGVGAWARLERDEVTVPANAEVQVPFQLTVPAGTRPGDYAGALIIQAPPQQGETAQLDDGTAVRLDVVQRLGVRIYLNVAGEAVTALDPGELAWERHDDALSFSLPITNTGNTNLSPSVELQLDGWPGESRNVTFESSQDLLTGSTHVLEATIEDAPSFFFGTAEATITSEAGEAQVSDQTVYVDWRLLVAASLILGAAAVITWRLTRFVRRARRAIAEVEQRADAA